MTPDQLQRYNTLKAASEAGTITPDETNELGVLQGVYDVATGAAPAPVTTPDPTPEVAQPTPETPVEVTPQEPEPAPQPEPVQEQPVEQPQPEQINEAPSVDVTPEPEIVTPEPTPDTVTYPAPETPQVHPLVSQNMWLNTFITDLDNFVASAPEFAGRTSSLVKTKIEEAQLWLQKLLKEHNIEF